MLENFWRPNVCLLGAESWDLQSSTLCKILITPCADSERRGCAKAELQSQAEIMVLGGTEIHLELRIPLGYEESVQKQKTSF